jgi:general secretion pathway protein E
MRAHLAEILVNQYDLNEDDLAEARRLQDDKGGRIGDILVQQNNISEKQLLEALSIQYDLPYWPTMPLENAESEFTDKVPIQFLKKLNMVPLEYLNHITKSDCGLAPMNSDDSDTGRLCGCD